MGASLGLAANINSVNQNIATNIDQATSSTCQATCTESQTNDVIVINGSTVNSNGIGFSQSCSVDSSCIMKSVLDSNIQNIIDSVSSQANKALTGAFMDISANAQANFNNVDQNITNNITQMLTSTCNANAALNQSGSLFYVSNSTINAGQGFAGFSIGTNSPVSVNASCLMQNLSRASVYNKEQAQNTQSNTSISILAILIIGIVVIIVVLAIVGGVVAATRKPSPKTGPSFMDTIDQAALLSLAQKGKI